MPRWEISRHSMASIRWNTTKETGLKEDQYYLMMFDNNYWVNGTRDDYEIEDLPEEVGTVLASDSLKSHVYVYLVDEGEKPSAWRMPLTCPTPVSCPT